MQAPTLVTGNATSHHELLNTVTLFLAGVALGRRTVAGSPSVVLLCYG